MPLAALLVATEGEQMHCAFFIKGLLNIRSLVQEKELDPIRFHFSPLLLEHLIAFVLFFGTEPLRTTALEHHSHSFTVFLADLFSSCRFLVVRTHCVRRRSASRSWRRR